jgi:hypothetical protein
MLSDTFAGIAPRSVIGFVLAELVGAGLALILHRGLGNDAASSAGSATSS